MEAQVLENAQRSQDVTPGRRDAPSCVLSAPALGEQTWRGDKRWLPWQEMRGRSAGGGDPSD